MRLFMVRHGQTTSNLNQVFAGQANAMLTDLGRQQALSIRPILADFHFDKVYTSDLTRAIETQKLALPGAVSTPTPLIRELDEGSLTSTSIQEAKDRYGSEFCNVKDFRDFGGENAEMGCARLREFLSQLEADPCDNVIAFAHHGMMVCMLQLVLGVPCASHSLVNTNCAIHVFDFDGKRWRLAAWNYMGKI